MKTVGLWIDHREAVIVTLIDRVGETTRITSGIEELVRYSNTPHGSHDDTTEIRRDREDRRFDAHLSKYYGEVIDVIRNADSILIFGPGEAKDKLRKKLESRGLAQHIVEVRTADKLSENQIVAKVRNYFRN